ncbi:hypothetical protein TDB9533_03269 [Thalassocella blandensis]|nr:hypothetical protein TDB9533_03269 [Thalassocella blandensis]
MKIFHFFDSPFFDKPKSNTHLASMFSSRMLRNLSLGLMLFITPLTTYAAWDCHDTPPYPVDASITINSGDVYQHLGSAYRCGIGGWCSSPALWAFEPGVGYYWEQAWESLGPCADFHNTAPQLQGISITDPVDGSSIEYPAEAVLAVDHRYQVAISVVDSESNLASWSLSTFEKLGTEYRNEQFIKRGDIAAQAEETIYAELRTGIRTNTTYGLRITVTDSAGATSEWFYDFDVVGETTSPLTISSTHAVYLGEYGSTAVRAWNPVSMPARPDVTLPSGSLSNVHIGNSTSSGGAAIGFDYQLSYSWQAIALGPMTFVASDDEREVTAVTEVLPQDGLPLIRVEAPAQAGEGETVRIVVTALDHDQLTLAQLTQADTVVPASSTQARMQGEQQWGLDLSYELDMPGHAMFFTVVAQDGDGHWRYQEINIGLASDGHSCASQAIDVDSVPAYPDWPRLDWQGLPSHAINGDRMVYENALYQARWWTQSIPGSNDAWEFLCDL